MAVTTDPFVTADLTASLPQIWTDIINEAKFPQFVLQDFVQDLSEYVPEGGRILHVPNIFTNIFTVSSQATQGAEITTQGPAQVDVTLTINTHKYVSWIIGDADLVQVATKYAINEKYAMEATRLLKQDLEDALFALYSSLTPTAIGTGVAAIADLDVRQAIRTLANANFELTEMAFFFSPQVYFDQLIGLSKIAPNYSGNMNTIATATLFNGGTLDNSRAMGILYGVPVFISSRVPVVTTTTRNILLHKAAFGYAVQGVGVGKDKIRVQMENQLRNLGMLAVVDIRYGVAALRVDAGVVLNDLTAGSVA
jgi:hypothetical protein